jgi:hypothetical protein
MSSHWTVCVCERMVFFSVMRILDLHFSNLSFYTCVRRCVNSLFC